MRRNRGDLSFLLARLDRPRHGAKFLYGDTQTTVEAALDVDAAGARDDVARAVGEDRMRQDG